jgi:tetratricopeptide (TPR) repeat protein
MFFPEIRDFEMLMDREADEMLAAGKGLWSLELAPVWAAPPSDLDLWERYDLPWVENNRCPVACLLGPGDAERPDRRQLAFLEGLLAALAATAEEEIDTGRWCKRVATSEGPMDFVLSLPGLLEPEEARPVESIFSWRVSERALRKIGKLLRAGGYASLEEANEAIAHHLQEGSPETEPHTPEERAEELMDRAWETPGRRAVLLARQALEGWPDCADAYNLLAGRAANPQASRELYERGLAAGERALGAELFEEEVGHFWGLLETRPYMRARQGLAEALVELKRYAEAAEHFQEMLLLNPNDNQGVRESLVHVLIALDRDAEAEELLDRYGEDLTAAMVYPRTLLRFRREGDSFEARRWLKRALKANQFVPGFLLGKRGLASPPGMYSPGSEDEAALYLLLSGDTWKSTPGALDWLRQQTTLPPRRQATKNTEKRRKKKRRR